MSPLLRASCCHPDKSPGQFPATGLTKTEAEVLLDWLEVHGHRDCLVSHVAGEGFTVSK
jgi:hypothetical protein